MLLDLFSFITITYDVHPNPRLSLSNASLNTDANSSVSTPYDSATKHLICVHYNFQNLMQNIDVLYTGRREYDIIGLTDSWLNS